VMPSIGRGSNDLVDEVARRPTTGTASKHGMLADTKSERRGAAPRQNC
jgi:hypothetical protein